MAQVLRRYWWLIVGVAGVLVGLGLIAASNPWSESSSSFGWFAYSPTEGEDILKAFYEESERRSTLMWSGVAVVAVSLIVIAAGVGYRFGLRRGASPAASTSRA